MVQPQEALTLVMTIGSVPVLVNTNSWVNRFALLDLTEIMGFFLELHYTLLREAHRSYRQQKYQNCKKLFHNMLKIK